MAQQETKPAGFGEDDMTRASGWDALLDDLFGLNVRAVRSIFASVLSPAKLFTAARDADWLGRYTPSIRLVFTLIAVTVFLRFLWADEGSGLFQGTRDLFGTLADTFQGYDLDQLTRDYLNIYLIAFPTAYFIVHALFALVLRVWGKGTPLAVRIRLYFATLVPGLLLGVAMMGLMAALTFDQLTAWLFPMFGVVWAVYALTYFRGMAPRMSTGPRLWRSALTATLIVIADNLGSFAAYVASMSWIIAQNTPV